MTDPKYIPGVKASVPDDYREPTPEIVLTDGNLEKDGIIRIQKSKLAEFAKPGCTRCFGRGYEMSKAFHPEVVEDDKDGYKCVAMRTYHLCGKSGCARSKLFKKYGDKRVVITEDENE